MNDNTQMDPTNSSPAPQPDGANPFGSSTVDSNTVGSANDVGGDGNVNSVNGGGSAITPAPAPHKRSILKWVLIIGIPAIIIIGALTWYLAIFSSKYNVVRSALYNFIGNRDNTAEYQLKLNSYASSGPRITIDGKADYLASGNIDGEITANISYSGKSMGIGTVKYASDSNDLYINISPDDDLNELIPTLSQLGSAGLFDQWIKITSDDLTSSLSATDASGQSADPARVLQCFQNGADELDDRASQQQIVDALLDTGFLVINSSSGDNNGTMYSLSLDGDHYADFINRIQNSNIVQSVTNCLSDNGIDTDTDLDDDALQDVADEINDTNPTIRLWIKGAFSRKLTRMQLTINSANKNQPDINLTVDLANQVPTIDMPSDAKDLNDVLNSNPSTTMELLNVGGSLTGGNSGSGIDPGDVTPTAEDVLESGTNTVDY